MKGIFTADLHIRKDIPRCRTDADWMDTQRRALLYVYSVAKERDCPVYIAGDVFNTSREPNECINMFLSVLKQFPDTRTGMIAGNHDLPYHAWENVDRSSIGVIFRAFPDIIPTVLLTDLAAYHFGKEREEGSKGISELSMIHRLIFPDSDSRPPFSNASTAEELLEQYPESKWIFTGDYHRAFHFEKIGHHVVNPGTLLIQRADEAEYRTGFYFVDTEKSVVEFISTPAELNAGVNTQYLEDDRIRNDRIEKFTDTVRKKGSLSLSFLDNLRDRISGIKDENIKNILIEVMEEIQ